MYRRMTGDGDIIKKIKDAETKIELAQKKKGKLLELVTLDSITADDFKSMTSQCNNEIRSLEQELSELHQQEESSQEFMVHMANVRSVLKAAEADVANGVITKEFVDTFIDKIFVTPEEDGSMRLDIKIFTGDTTEKYLQKLKRRAGIITATNDRNEESPYAAGAPEHISRAGHTFKKMNTIRILNYKRKNRNALGHIVEVKYTASIEI